MTDGRMDGGIHNIPIAFFFLKKGSGIIKSIENCLKSGNQVLMDGQMNIPSNGKKYYPNTIVAGHKNPEKGLLIKERICLPLCCP